MKGRIKRFVKRVLMGLYRRTESLRRLLLAEFEANFRTCFASSFEEVRLSLDGLVAEVYRLQAQVEELREETARLRLERHEVRPADERS